MTELLFIRDETVTPHDAAKIEASANSTLSVVELLDIVTDYERLKHSTSPGLLDIVYRMAIASAHQRLAAVGVCAFPLAEELSNCVDFWDDLFGEGFDG